MPIPKHLLSLTFAPVLVSGLFMTGSAQAQTFTWDTFAGTANVAGNTDSPALFRMPSGGVFDSAGNLYVSDTYNHTIRKVEPDGTTTLFAGKAKVSGRQDGTGALARFNMPSGLAIDEDDNLYVADTGNHTIRMIDTSGEVSTIAGIAGKAGGQNSTAASGTTGAVSATFNGPTGIAVDSTGKIYVAEQFNHTIRVISLSGDVTTLAGSIRAMGFKDGTGTAALFNQPTSIVLRSDTELYVTDSQNQVIRKVTSAGVVTTYAGKARTVGSANGALTAARFRVPTGIASDYKGNLYIADQGNQTIRKIKTSGEVITIGGTVGKRGAQNGVGLATKFNFPRGIAVGPEREIYVFDRVSQRIAAGKPQEGEINVTDAADTPITSLSFTPTTILATNTLTFKITNTAAVDLTNISSALSGTNTGDFVVSGVPSSLIPSGTAVITVNFTPTLKTPAVPNRTATLEIISDDVSEDPFVINLSGTAVP